MSHCTYLWFQQTFLRVYYAVGIVLDSRDTAVNKMDKILACGIYVPVKEHKDKMLTANIWDMLDETNGKRRGLEHSV